ncbi:MAG: DUF4160 domain-containing protein [Oscillospiraceae bacterium]|nr:DUF4160 domain-containing protein [Oscillospiraceae bacterium]
MGLPKLFEVGRYAVFFWSNEEGEPIHVHVSIKRPSTVSAKIWLTEDGGFIVAENDIIPRSNISTLLNILRDNHEDICDEWKKFFNTDTIKFYC